MSGLTPHLLLATANDDRFPPEAMLDGDEKTFFLTTGMYPHEILLNFGQDTTVNLNKVTLVCSGVKKIRIERCKEEYATEFEPMVDCDVNAAPEGTLQREAFQINKATVGAGVRYVKIVILQGHESFASIHSVGFAGERMAASS